ncbi:MAG: hypothetical protein WA139_05180 [Candidatus Aenigmatarchaeota archaeon]
MEKADVRITDYHLKIVDLMVASGLYENRNKVFEAAVAGLIRKESGKHR